MAQGEFSVYWWDRQDRQVVEHRFVDIEQVKSSILRLTKGSASRLGFITRVMVTDGGDFCAFEWSKEKGVIFPTEEDINGLNQTTLR
jgi:hypothetical protein